MTRANLAISSQDMIFWGLLKAICWHGPAEIYNLELERTLSPALRTHSQINKCLRLFAGWILAGLLQFASMSSSQQAIQSGIDLSIRESCDREAWEKAIAQATNALTVCESDSPEQSAIYAAIAAMRIYWFLIWEKAAWRTHSDLPDQIQRGATIAGDMVGHATDASGRRARQSVSKEEKAYYNSEEKQEIPHVIYKRMVEHRARDLAVMKQAHVLQLFYVLAA